MLSMWLTILAPFLFYKLIQESYKDHHLQKSPGKASSKQRNKIYFLIIFIITVEGYKAILFYLLWLRYHRKQT